MSEYKEDETIGDRIRAKRLAIGLSQIALADAAEVRGTTMWRYEKGRLSPGPEPLSKMATKLGVTVEWLLHGDTSPTPETTLHRDDELGIKLVEDFLAEMGDAVSPEHARELRDQRWSNPTPGRIRGYWTGMVGDDAGKAAARPDIEPPQLRPGRVKLKG